jgi:hypothetical protein
LTLSIDSCIKKLQAYQRKACNTRSNQYIAKREIFEEFLKDLNSLLDSPDFDIEMKFILTGNRFDGKKGETLVALNQRKFLRN